MGVATEEAPGDQDFAWLRDRAPKKIHGLKITTRQIEMPSTPDVRAVSRAAARRPARPSRSVLVLLTLTSLIGPTRLVMQALRHRVTDALAIALGCTTLLLLVV